MTYKVFDVRTAADLDTAFADATSDGIQALFINQNPLLFTVRVQVASLAARVRLPAITSSPRESTPRLLPHPAEAHGTRDLGAAGPADLLVNEKTDECRIDHRKIAGVRFNKVIDSGDVHHSVISAKFTERIGVMRGWDVGVAYRRDPITG